MVLSSYFIELICLLNYLLIHTCTCVLACRGRGKGSLQELVLFFHLWGPRDPTQVSKPSSKCPDSLSHPASPTFLNSSLGKHYFLLHTVIQEGRLVATVLKRSPRPRVVRIQVYQATPRMDINERYWLQRII